jgi:hypothetical protein
MGECISKFISNKLYQGNERRQLVKRRKLLSLKIDMFQLDERKRITNITARPESLHK